MTLYNRMIDVGQKELDINDAMKFANDINEVLGYPLHFEINQDILDINLGYVKADEEFKKQREVLGLIIVDYLIQLLFIRKRGRFWTLYFEGK